MTVVAGATLALLLACCGCAGRETSAISTVFDPESVPDAYALSAAALAWPGATRAFQVTPAGDLYNGDWIVHIDPSAGVAAAAGPPRVVAFEDRWLPIAHWIRRSGSVRWEFEAVALPERLDEGSGGVTTAVRDSNLLVSLEARATNTGPAASQATLRLALAPGDDRLGFVAWDAPEQPAPCQWGSDESGAMVQAWTKSPARESEVARSWSLAPGQSASETFVIPAYAVPARDLSRWARVPHAKRADQARLYWRHEVDSGTRFELGDPEVENAIRAALVVLLSCRERHGDTWVPIGSPLQYRDVWIRDGAREVLGLSVLGRTREARDLARGLLQLQWPQGAFASQVQQMDGTGQALWAFEQALLRPPSPAESLVAYLGPVMHAWRWTERQREIGREVGWSYGSMLPAVDPRDNEAAFAQLVGNDAWAIRGYQAAARLTRAAGFEADARQIEATRERYRGDFLAAMARARSPDVPASWQGLGRDWGNLAVSWPCEVLAADDARCAALARRVWAKAGGAGLCTYGSADSLHYYLGADLATWALLSGRRSQADSVLAAMLAWRSASGGACELFSRSSRGYGRNAPPHATAAAALIATVRNALVFDDADTLALTLGARDAWWRNGGVRAAPTRWGTIDLQFRRDSTGAEWQWTPVSVWTVLTLPAGTMAAGDPAAPLMKGSRDDQVLAPPGTSRARISLRPARVAARPR